MMIRHWTGADAAWLRPTIIDFLRVGRDRGGEMEPTIGNAERLLGLGLQLAHQGDPTLLGLEGDEPIGWVLWGDPLLGAGFYLRWRTCHTFGSYVDPIVRHTGVAIELRTEALRLARVRGYERVIGPMHLVNQAGIEHFATRYGAWPTAVQMEVLL